jgi:hypothetical protein
MNEIDASYHALGEQILEELVVRAGLGRTDSAEVSVSLNFTVSASASDKSLLIRSERIGNQPLEILLQLS